MRADPFLRAREGRNESHVLAAIHVSSGNRRHGVVLSVSGSMRKDMKAIAALVERIPDIPRVQRTPAVTPTEALQQL
jgi:hypothetical protein